MAPHLGRREGSDSFLLLSVLPDCSARGSPKSRNCARQKRRWRLQPWPIQGDALLPSIIAHQPPLAWGRQVHTVLPDRTDRSVPSCGFQRPGALLARWSCRSEHGSAGSQPRDRRALPKQRRVPALLPELPVLLAPPISLGWFRTLKLKRRKRDLFLNSRGTKYASVCAFLCPLG